MLFDAKTVFGVVESLLQASPLCAPPNGTSIVLSSQADADELSLCDIVDGSVYINATGSISLHGLRGIAGSLSAKEGVSAITSNSIMSIGGILQLEDLAGLESLAFSSLISVGSLSLYLPDLRTLSIAAGLQNLSGITVDGHLERSFVVNGTKIDQLQGLNFPIVDELAIENNANLESITLDLEILGNKTSIARNGDGASLSYPFLKTILGNNTSFQNLQHIDMPRLRTITGSLQIENNKMNAFYLDNLISVSGQLGFQDNGLLQNVSAPLLRNVGGLVIKDNPSLRVLDGLNSLEDASTEIILIGNQTSVAFPNLTSVENFYLVSSDDDFDCRSFENLRCRGIIIDQYQCQGSTASIASSPSSCDNSHRGSGLTLFGKLLIALEVLIGLLLAVALIYCLLRCLSSGGDEKFSKHKHIQSNTSDVWFDSTLDADTRYLYISHNQVMNRAGRSMNGLWRGGASV